MSQQSKTLLDENQYTEENIGHYELIFGKQFVCTGGLEIIEGFAQKLQLKPGDKVLDFGSGLGGNAFYLASNYKANVLGVDLSKNMITKANKYLNSADAQIQKNVKFELRDVTEEGFLSESFDCIFTRETIVHIQNKETLFRNFHKWLVPGAKLLISDYFLGPNSSLDFLDYIESRNYRMIPLLEYKHLLEQVGFHHVELTDMTKTCIEILKNDVERLENMKNSDKATIDNWKKKLQRCINGNQGWGMVLAKK